MSTKYRDIFSEKRKNGFHLSKSDTLSVIQSDIRTETPEMGVSVLSFMTDSDFDTYTIDYNYYLKKD